VSVYVAKQPANTGHLVSLNHEVETKGSSSSALLCFEDKTWVEVGGNSSFCRSRGLDAVNGRRVSLNSGTLQSHIEKQPRPMVFVTPNAEATVLGTTIRLSFSREPRPKTILEVKEGKVRLR